MVGTFDYNKVPVIRAFLVFFFQQTSRFLKLFEICSIQMGTVKISRTCLGNLLSVTPLVEGPALKDIRKVFHSHRQKVGRKRLTLQVIVSRLGYMALHLLQTC